MSKRKSWKKLKTVLESELIKTLSLVKHASSNEDFIGANNYKESAGTIEWILSEMKSLENTGELL